MSILRGDDTGAVGWEKMTKRGVVIVGYAGTYQHNANISKSYNDLRRKLYL